jgi:hypothetical protein
MISTPRDVPLTQGLRPERAEHVDLGIEHRVSNALRWQLTIFHRRERDILRDPALETIAGGDEQAWLVSDRNVNALILAPQVLDKQLTAVFHYPNDAKLICRKAIDDAFQAVRV